ncbi:CDP-glucose 4,6-dehydratase [Desulfovibrio porci]|uniref:CDP-glucose 4,6-dehydratase n=1 Tax=Desulfovibrio porci TaxID=2605782 RepID=UPI003A94A551
MFANAYQGRRVFVTGHTGFKGSWLAAWLTRLGATVGGFSDGIPTEPSHFAAMNLGAHLEDMRGDIRDRRAMLDAVRRFKPEVVFHLAAQALVRKSYEDPAGTFEANMLGTMNMLEAVRACPSVRAVVMITSDKCYRNDEWVWGYRETDHLGGADPYSASKGCAEIIAHSYFQSFFREGPACATVRAGNVIGGGDWALDRIVPDCARAWAEGRAVQIRSPWATRPWQLVLEPLSGYLWLGARLLDSNGTDGATTGLPFDPRGQAYNFGPAADVNNTVAEVVQALARHWPGFAHQTDAAGQAGMKECTLLKLCCDKALAHLGWKATLSFDETIRYTAEWYHRFYRGRDGRTPPDMLDFSLGQIVAYTNAAEQRGQVWVR